MTNQNIIQLTQLLSVFKPLIRNACLIIFILVILAQNQIIIPESYRKYSKSNSFECRSSPQNRSNSQYNAVKNAICTLSNLTTNLNSRKKQRKIVQAQLRRNLPCAVIQIQKNINIKPRLNSFEVKYKKLLIFSKLEYGKFANAQDIVNIVLGVSRRNRYEIEKIILQLANQDLYSYLKRKSGTVKISYKFIMCQISKMLENNVENLKLLVNHMNSTVDIPIAQNQARKTRPNTSRIINYMGKQKQSAIKQVQEETKSKTMKQVGKQNGEYIGITPRDSQFTNRRGASRYSIRESRGILKNGLKCSMFKKQEDSQKYTYLSKQMDVECQESGVAQDFEIQELSEEDGKQQDDATIDQQKLMQIKIQSGLNFRLTANYSERRYSRKYSSEYQKFAQLLEQELKEDQLKLQTQCSKFQQEAANSSSKRLKSNQSSGSQSNQLPSVYQIDQNELESKRDLWNDSIQNTKRVQLDLLEESKLATKEKEQQVIDNPQSNQNFVASKKSLKNKSQNYINCAGPEENIQQVNKKEIELRINQFRSLKNYQIGFQLLKIHGDISERAQKQIDLDNQNIESLQELSHVILYVHKLHPNHFSQILHISDLACISLSAPVTENKITLFSPAIGMFQTYNIKIKMSKSYQGALPAWVVIVCQGVLQLLQNCEQGIYQIFRILTGAPIVKLSAVDLRRIKRVVVQNIFENKNQRKGKVLCSKQIQPNNQLQFCELVDFEKDKDFLQSKVTYVKYLSVCNETYETTSKSYEEFVLNYQNIMLCFFKNNYYHNQQKCFFEQNMSETRQKATEYFWGIQIQLFSHTELFLEFNQHQKLEKQNHILISKLVDQQSQPIGELIKKGNFFFELSLEAGAYLIQITRSFNQQQVDSVHFFSSNMISIKNSQIISK